MRTTLRSDWATYNDLKESIATVFDVATLAAAPTLFVRWTWRVRYVALERESHPFTAPRPLGNLLSPSSLSHCLCLSVSLTPDPYVDFSLSYTLTHARRKSANTPDADVGPPLIHLPRHPRSFSVLNLLLRDEFEWNRHATFPSCIYIVIKNVRDLYEKQFSQMEPVSWMWKNFYYIAINFVVKGQDALL